MSRRVKWIAGTFVIWIAITMLYCSFDPGEVSGVRLHLPQYNVTEDFLINTPGCYIPNYAKTLKFYEADETRATCGERAVIVERKSQNEITFRIDAPKLKRLIKNKKLANPQCCYRFAWRSDTTGEENDQLIYSTNCNPIQNGTTTELLHEVITIKCVDEKKKTFYEDAYIILKKVPQKLRRKKKSWNVLLLGLDTMSRARAFSALPRTVKYLMDYDWLDYRAYQKVASNTFPNLMAVLTGKNASSAYSDCQRNMEACNEIMMWSRYRQAGYSTAYAEDNLRLPDTFAKFGGFKTSPTDHYMRPFFLTGEKQKGNYICTATMPSALNVLNYAYDFAKAYTNTGFFGLFWINSLSHNSENSPKLFENDLISFFDKLNRTGVLNDTFILFLSDHGVRFGRTRVEKESFFEERLPMLFIWVPLKFQQQYAQEFRNMHINQNRLTTPYDIYSTLGSILQISSDDTETYRPEGCVQCTSLLKEMSPNRNCLDAAVDEKWCTCHGVMVDTNQSDTEGNHSLQLAVAYIQNRTKNIETIRCTTCSPLKLKSVLRSQSYRNKITNSTYYVMAFSMSPGDVAYEVTVENYGTEYNIVQPTDTISKYNVRGSCTKNPNNRGFCVCQSDKCRH